MEVINILEQEGADIYLLNRDGLNCLHLAAQGGSPFIMVCKYQYPIVLFHGERHEN